MEPNIAIRRGKLTDINNVYNLGLRIKELNFSRKIRFHEKREMKEWIKKPRDNLFFTALDSRKVVGFVYAKIVDKDWCMLDNIAVAEDYRRTGIGTNLLNKVCQELKKRKVTYIQALVEEHHTKARKFWENHRFQKGKIFVWYEKRLK